MIAVSQFNSMPTAMWCRVAASVAKKQYVHAKGRCWIRLHQRFSRADHRRLVERIQLRQDIIKTIEINNLKVEHVLYYKGVLCRVIYDRRTARILTFIPVSKKEKKKLEKSNEHCV